MALPSSVLSRPRISSIKSYIVMSSTWKMENIQVFQENDFCSVKLHRSCSSSVLFQLQARSSTWAIPSMKHRGESPRGDTVALHRRSSLDGEPVSKRRQTTWIQGSTWICRPNVWGSGRLLLFLQGKKQNSHLDHTYTIKQMSFCVCMLLVTFIYMYVYTYITMDSFYKESSSDSHYIRQSNE